MVWTSQGSKRHEAISRVTGAERACRPGRDTTVPRVVPKGSLLTVTPTRGSCHARPAMTPLKTPVLVCRICRIEVTLDTEPVVRMAEVATFCAAHNTHAEGLGVELVISLRGR